MGFTVVGDHCFCLRQLLLYVTIIVVRGPLLFLDLLLFKVKLVVGNIVGFIIFVLITCLFVSLFVSCHIGNWKGGLVSSLEILD